MSLMLSAMGQSERSLHWQDRTAQFIKEAPSIPPGKIIFLGNSITEGFDLDHYFPESKTLNRGISGDHVDGLLERMAPSVLDLQPAKVFILIGINDIGVGESDSTILFNYHALMERMQKHLPDTVVYIQSILPTTSAWPNCPPDKIVRINARLKQLAADHGFHWINIYPEFVNDDGYLEPEFTHDGLHLNSAGYDQWSKILKQYDLK